MNNCCEELIDKKNLAHQQYVSEDSKKYLNDKIHVIDIIQHSSAIILCKYHYVCFFVLYLLFEFFFFLFVCGFSVNLIQLMYTDSCFCRIHLVGI